MRAEITEPVQALLGEGAHLFPDGLLRWVDLLRGEVYVRESGRSRVIEQYPYEVSKVLPWHGGHLALTRVGIEAVTVDGEPAWMLDLTRGDDSLRCSDATVLPDGSIAVGIVDRELVAGRGELVRVHTDGTITSVVTGATIPNGIDVTADARDVVWVDSPTRTLMRLAIDPNLDALGAPRPWAVLPEAWGVPDGLCADRDGGAWVAMWGGARVVHVDAEGSFDASITLPVEHVTSVAFDADDTLIITTACVALDEEQRAQSPGAGALWSAPVSTHQTRGVTPRISTLAPRRKVAS